MTDNDIKKALECCCKGDKKIVLNVHYKTVGIVTRQQAEIERLKETNNLLTEAGQEWQKRYNATKAEITRLQKRSILNGLKVVNKERKQIKFEAIKEITAELYNSFRQYENYDRLHIFEILDRIESVEEFLLNNLVKEMTEVSENG